jgi:hypothetical protein
MSLRIWRSCSSRLFRSSLIRGIDSFSSVLLHPRPTADTQHQEAKKKVDQDRKPRESKNRDSPPRSPRRRKPARVFFLPLGAAEAAAGAALEEGVQHRHDSPGPARHCLIG